MPVGGDVRKGRMEISMKLGFIGLGNMAKAVMAGLLKKQIVDAGDIWGSAKTQATRESVAEVYHIHTELDNREVAAASDVIILAVKPQFLKEVMDEIRPVLTKDKLIISMAAGKTLAWLQKEALPDSRIIRIMPNTAAMVSEGCTAVCRGAFATEADMTFTLQMCESFGTAQEIDEKLMDAFGALAGSSGAFAFVYMEALADGAVLAGMPRKMAYEFAAQATLGAALLMRETKEHPGVLKDMVCSPGGTTIEGIKRLEEGSFRGIVMDAVGAMVEKSKKL